MSIHILCITFGELRWVFCAKLLFRIRVWSGGLGFRRVQGLGHWGFRRLEFLFKLDRDDSKLVSHESPKLKSDI